MRLGARRPVLLPLSRQDADASFQKLEVTFSYGQSFADGQAASNLTADGQAAFGQALVRSEQIGIAGPGGLSSFDADTLRRATGAMWCAANCRRR